MIVLIAYLLRYSYKSRRLTSSTVSSVLQMLEELGPARTLQAVSG